MADTVLIKSGRYRGHHIVNETFTLVKAYKPAASGMGGFVTVSGTKFNDAPASGVVRVTVRSMKDIQYNVNGKDVDGDDADAPVAEIAQSEAPAADPFSGQNDEEALERIKERFEILDEMACATACGEVRAMIVVGPPGVGKSFGVLTQLEKQYMLTPDRYQVVKGQVSALGLYAKLYEYKDQGKCLVFDDCDSILKDEESLNILKAALDTSKRRSIHWNSDSRMLRAEHIPNSFDFHGSVIFITNIDFNRVLDAKRGSKTQDHLGAIASRCHYIDLAMYSLRDRFLRIKQIQDAGTLFAGYGFGKDEEAEVIDFMVENKERLREVSLRTAIKIADLRKSIPNGWQRVARITTMR